MQKQHQQPTNPYTIKAYTLGNALTLSLLMMGWALSNHYIRVWSLPCSYGVLLHAGYFICLYHASYIYGAKSAYHLWVLSIASTLCFIGFGALILHVFPTQQESLAKVALWEKRLPTEVITTFIISSIVFVVTTTTSIHTSNIRHHLTLQVATHSIVHLLLGPSFHPRQIPLEIVQGNALGTLTIQTAICVLCYVLYSVVPIKQHRSFSTTTMYQTLLLFFCAACLVTNLLVVKHISVFGWHVTAALFVYALTFTLTDVLAELYGYQQTSYIVWSGLLTNFIVFAAVVLGSHLPLHSKAPVPHVFFEQTFAFVEITIVASIITYTIAQSLDIRLFDALRKKTAGQHLWLRNNLAAMISQGVDTILFALLAWGLWLLLPPNNQSLTWATWSHIAWNEYLWKLLLALADTPLVYLLIAIGKRSTTTTHSTS